MFSTIAFSVNFYLLDPEEIHLSEFASGVARLQGLFIVAKFRVAKSTGLANFVTIAAKVIVGCTADTASFRQKFVKKIKFDSGFSHSYR